MKIDAATVSEAVSTLKTLREFKPFRYGGTWHVAVINGQAHAYRSVERLTDKAARAGLKDILVAIVSPG